MKKSIRKTLLWLILSLPVWAHAAAVDAEESFVQDLKPTVQETQAAHMAADILALYHYREVPPDPVLSAKVFDQYLKSLDSEKLFLLQTDVDRFSGDSASIAQKVRQDDLSIPFAIYDLYAHRAAERFQYARKLLKLGFDFQVSEDLQVSRSLQPWSQTSVELDDVWRKRVKSDWLSLKLAGKDHKSIVTMLDKRYERAIKRMGQTQSADAFQIFMNAYTMAIEPHTNYMGPNAAAEFDISMSLSLVGIGVAVSDAEDFATIMAVTEGGPASRSKQLRAGDRIVGVAQGARGEMTNVIGLRSEDLVSLIRGPVGTVVKLAVLPADAGVSAERKVVTLVRQPIAMEGQAARSSIETRSDGAVSRRIGVITLPSFYEDFAGRQADETDFRSATRDVKKLLSEFNASHVDGVLIDLRDNGGGSLSQAIELTSLFVGNVPVVQQRNATGDVMLGVDNQASVLWHGPLGVLINKRSASASEIFAAAIQDYGRGVIMGQSSYGKGTVQLMVDLDGLVKNDKPQLGELKMTIAQFFRVNGGTTQLKGVTPDIGFSGYFDGDALGESAFDNALPWTMIKAVHNAPNATIGSIVPALVAKHESRTQLDADFKQLREDMDERQRQRDKNEISLNEPERRQERAARQAQLTARQADTHMASPCPSDTRATTSLAAQGTTLEDGMLSGERSFEEELRAEKSMNTLKDIVLIESTRIMNDAIGLLQAGQTQS
ncbi:carboxy terminal-processing peptidase [Hydrogenophaga sp. PAMC20947]|uniref:carboxy terminal-processing peptidase n=1 Tax=Hydrogenophaga sp. PAMC20947 TaxID=2565558 RepID=UPI00109DC046|nr:carboxy terminal-processing peptidase [Hydrogenophaga sp. PAMC20947]QCB48451.1 tail-specific protease [Hydrogenophaga sp. PAMC20947]